MDDSLNPFASPRSDSGPATLVEAACFRGMTLSGFVDRFRVYQPASTDLAARIVHFYRQAGAQVVSAEFPLRFRRGNWLGSLLGPERWARQEIVIHCRDDPALVLELEYRLQMVLPIRPPTPDTYIEVSRLATELEAMNPG